ncbi:uncharacterized protein LOC123532899 isoform X2 [Mercenaria mercenaria]|uniref:uncharacterized protein LOC123532899 isoform X2 n=1 Tax=Mercenaria mercenaria TaxID=6596 RepID=UPI00234ECBB1|nr:uncharacterized protein LOC123532899 isoform X2 [Mercenaria mercenaria]
MALTKTSCETKNVFDENDIAFDIDIGFDETFVGRESDLQELNESWESNRIFGIFGLRSVGKSWFVREFLSRYIPKDTKQVHLNLKTLPDIGSLYTCLSASLEVKPVRLSVENEQWIRHLICEINNSMEKQFIFVFDDAEDYQESKGETTRNSFLSLCKGLAQDCKNVKVLITSTTEVQFSEFEVAYYRHEILPLKDADSRRLLKLVTTGIELGLYENAIVTLSEGLPLVILMIGSELTEDGGMLTPKDMVELLHTCRLKAMSREFYPPEDRIADIYKKFLDRLDLAFQHRLKVLEYIPGTFNHYQAKQILEIRGRYIKTFFTTMTNIARRLGTAEYLPALAEFTVEQPNLHKLLMEVQYTTQDNYQFFIEIATNCTGMIEHFMSGNGEIFYAECLKAADMYGQKEDKAAVNIAVGSLYTNTTGNLLGGQKHYQEALRILENQEKSLILATAYQRMGWNILLQGKNTEAIRYFEKSLAISLTSDERFQLIAVHSLSSMGVSLTFLGDFRRAEKYHLQSLRRRRMFQGENHPGMGACYNNIGEMYEMMGDSKEALEYYTKGLEVKKRCKASVLMTVISLCSVAKMNIAMEQFSEAHSLLDEGFKRLNEEKLPPKEAVACACDMKGIVFKHEGLLHNAEEMFRKAADIRNEIAPNNIPYFESLVHLADIYRMQGKVVSSIKFAEKVLELRENAVASMPHTCIIVDSLECIADIYSSKGDMQRQKETLKKLQSELLRLERVFLSQRNERDLKEIRRKLQTLNDELNSFTKNL